MAYKDTPEQKMVGELLQESIQYGLEIEVVYGALKIMREDDAISPSEAMRSSYEEWIK